MRRQFETMARPANMVAAWFKKFFVKFYAALDATQRKRATEIIRRYSYLIPKLGENSVEQKKALPSDDASYNLVEFGVIHGRERRPSKT